MSNTKKSTDRVNIEQLGAAILKQALAKMTSAGWSKLPKPSLSELAKDLGTSTYRIKVAVKHMHDGVPDDYHVGAGRPRNNVTVDNDMIVWATKPFTLRKQIGLNLNARVQEFNLRYRQDITEAHLRQMYKANHITQKKFTPRVGNPVLDPVQMQLTLLNSIKGELNALWAEGYIICQIDEACFSPKKNDRRHWANAGGMEVRERFTSMPQIKVCAAICEEVGTTVTMFSQQPFTGVDMVSLFERLRTYFGPDRKVAIFLDNATYHKSAIVKEAAVAQRIPLVFNAPYRPDLNGIELFWRKAKTTYYKFVDNWRAHGLREWDQPELVRRCVEEVQVGLVKKIAKDGWARVMSAEPIKPEDRPWESGVQAGHAEMQNWLTCEELATQYSDAAS